MIVKTIKLAHEFDQLNIQGSEAKLTCYLADLALEIPQPVRPSILIIPGGGYDTVSQREGEPVALQFLAKGFNTYVLDYSTQSKVNRRFPSQLFEAMSALQYIKNTVKDYAGDPRKIHVMGFSAGGHLAGSLAYMGVLPQFITQLGLPADSDMSVQSVALIYPVVSTNVSTHARSFENIQTEKYPKEMLALEQYVTEKSPALFAVSSSDDSSVPVANTLLIVQTYAKAKKPFELHIYERAFHGFSLANELVSTPEVVKGIDKHVPEWVALCQDFMLRQGR